VLDLAALREQDLELVDSVPAADSAFCAAEEAWSGGAAVRVTLDIPTDPRSR